MVYTVQGAILGNVHLLGSEDLGTSDQGSVKVESSVTLFLDVPVRLAVHVTVDIDVLGIQLVVVVQFG